MPVGKVALYSWAKGYGFLESPDLDDDLFVHHSDVHKAGLGGLEHGQSVEFELGRCPDGRPKAVKLKTLGYA